MCGPGRRGLSTPGLTGKSPYSALGDGARSRTRRKEGGDSGDLHTEEET